MGSCPISPKDGEVELGKPSLGEKNFCSPSFVGTIFFWVIFQGCRQGLVKYYVFIYPDMNFSIFGFVVDLFFWEELFG